MIERLLTRLARGLGHYRIPYMVIGGQAVLLYGHARLTQDVDVTLGVDTDRFSTVLAACRVANLIPLVAHPQTFVRETHVLPLKDPASGLRVDLVFSNTRYERQALQRARRIRMGRIRIRFASLEDVVIHKLIAGRPIDVEDVRVMLMKHRGRVDRPYIRRWLRAFVASGVLSHNPLKNFDELEASLPRTKGTRYLTIP